MDKLRVAILGCGKQSHKHISGLRTVADAEIVLADIDTGLACALAEDENLEHLGAPDEVFTDPTIQAVDICAPTTAHFPLIRSALEAGKHVFCEKPLCETMQEAQAIRELEERTGRHVMVGYIYRYAPAFAYAGRLMHGDLEGAMGKPLSAFFRLGGVGDHQTWKHQKDQGGGAVSEMLVHMLDLAHWYFGPLTDVRVEACEMMKPVRTVQGQTFDADAEDYIRVSCRGARDTAIAFVSDMMSGEFVQYAEIQGIDGSFFGSIKADLPSHLSLTRPFGHLPRGKNALDLKAVNLYAPQMQAFADMARTGEPPSSNTVEDSVAIMGYLSEIKQQEANLCPR